METFGRHLAWTDEPGAGSLRSLPEHLADVASAHPDAAAIVAHELLVTHGELDLLAAKIAGALVAQVPRVGGEGARVAVFVEPGAANIIDTLGVLKTGAAAVLLDPLWTDDRLEWAMATCEPAAIVTSEACRAAAERIATRVPVLTPDDFASPAEWRRGHPIPPDAPAFVLTTSGSTGGPKAVVDLHQNVVHEALRLGPSLRLAPGDRQTLLRANCAGAVSDVFCALLAGAAVAPFDPINETYASFHRWLEAMQPTVWRSTPSLFTALFVDAVAPQLRAVFWCGEPAFGSDLEHFRRATNDDCILINCYGTTETATATVAVYPHDGPAVRGPLAIGESVVDVDVILVDDCGVHVEGEGAGQLVVRSPYLAAGYLDDQRAPSDRFGSDDVGRRSYLTGDMGERRADGSLICLGRLGTNAPDQMRRTARSAASADEPLGRTHGLTWNGKLPLQRSVQAAGAASSVAELADQIARVWASVFDRSSVGTNENFFELGGTSLLALACCKELEQQLDVEVAPALLLQLPTPSSLARGMAEGGARREDSRAIVPMQTSGQRPPLFLVHGKGGDVFGWAELSRALPAGRPIYGVQALRTSNGSPVHHSTEEMAGHYVGEIRAIQPAGPYHVCGISSGGRLAWAIAEILAAEGEEIGALVLVETGSVDELRWIGNLRLKLTPAIRRVAGRARRRLRRQPASRSEPDVYMSMLGRYRLGRLECDVSVFVGDSKTAGRVPFELCARAVHRWRDRRRVAIYRAMCADRTSGAVAVRRVRGQHVTMMEPPNVESLAAALADVLDVSE